MNRILGMAAAALALALAAPASAAVYTPITGDASYKLTLDDEFNGTAIDRTKWQVTYDGNPDHSYGTYPNACFYNSTNLTVASGHADFAVTQGASPCNYRTAAITTNFLQEYGYFEVRAKVPANAHGIGANFWHDKNAWVQPEIDTFEWSGGNAAGGPACYSTSYIDVTGNWGTPIHPCGIDNAFHVFGMFWTPTTITMYLDGVQKAQYSNYNTAGHGSMWTLLSATVGPWGDLIDGTTVFPAHYQVDYVHMYSNASGAVAVTPQANYGGPGDDGMTTVPPPLPPTPVTPPRTPVTVACTLVASPVTVTVGGAAAPITATLKCQ